MGKRKVISNLEETHYSDLQNKFTKKVNTLFQSDEGKDIFNQLSKGNNKYLKFRRVENTSYDPRWIEAIEDCLFDLGQIVKNPKRVTQEVTDVVPIELARKTNSESITHLATHSQFVKEIDDDGNVIPNKILNIGADDFYKTYENRFIATLIRKLTLFIEKRYQFIVENTRIKETQTLYFKSKSFVDGKEVEIETKIKVSGEKEETEQEINTNQSFIKRIEYLRRYILYYYNSDFMKQFKTEKNVRNPILMTNIIRKNPLYNHCYRLYKFLDSYNLMGVNFKVNDDYSEFDDSSLREVNNALMVDFLTLRGLETKKAKKIVKEYKPKIVTSIDDEEFIYGNLYRCPIEFVRIDDGYRAYLEQIKNDLPLHPTKAEKEYYKEEYKNNKEIKEAKNGLDKLISLKNKEANKNSKKFEKIAAERDQEIINMQKIREEAEKQILLSQIDSAREKLSEKAILDKSKDKNINNEIISESSVEIQPTIVDEDNNKTDNKASSNTLEETILETPIEKVVEESKKEIIPEQENVPATTVVLEQDKQNINSDDIPDNSEPEIKEEANEETIEISTETVIEDKEEIQENAISQEIRIEENFSNVENSSLKVSQEELISSENKPELTENSFIEKTTIISEKEEDVLDKAPNEVISNFSENVIPIVENEDKKSSIENKELVSEIKNDASNETSLDKSKEETRNVRSFREIISNFIKNIRTRPQNTPKSNVSSEESNVNKQKKDNKNNDSKVDEKTAAKKIKLFRRPIPGVFIVKTPKGYYVGENQFSNMKDMAFIFDDFNDANDIKEELGGKVISLG